VTGKDVSTVAEGEWLTQVLVWAEGSNFAIGTQRNRTRAELLQYRVAGKDQLAQGRGGKGKLVIHYHSNDELDGILGKIR